jgi:acyl-coenzyme A synthetase/AMP-(fatty) acid ligase
MHIELIGAIWVGLNPRFRLPELQHVIADAEPRLLLALSLIDGRSYADEIGALGLPTVLFRGEPPVEAATNYDDFLDCIAASVGEPPTGQREPCLIVYTSGSTGKP